MSELSYCDRSYIVYHERVESDQAFWVLWASTGVPERGINPRMLQVKVAFMSISDLDVCGTHS